MPHQSFWKQMALSSRKSKMTWGYKCIQVEKIRD